jgi:hypothetical protein
MFLGQNSPTIQTTRNSIFGDWNGHLFSVDRKRCFIFMNNLTCYSIVMVNIQKKNTKDFGNIFKERLIRQLDFDLNLNEEKEIKLRKELNNILLTKSNNDKKIIGTINQHVENLKCINYGGGVENWEEVQVTRNLNTYLVGTKILPDRKGHRIFFRPIDLMEELIK